MARNNTILIVDDDLELLAYYWKLFEAVESSEFDILAANSSQKAGAPRVHRRLLCHRLGDSFKFVEMFEKMVHSGVRYPLCIIDMRMPGEDGKIDNRRGMHTAKRVRELDPDIHIVICTAYDFDGDEICAQIGSRAHFRQRPFEEEEFCALVHSLVDQWNDEH